MQMKLGERSPETSAFVAPLRCEGDRAFVGDDVPISGQTITHGGHHFERAGRRPDDDVTDVEGRHARGDKARQ